MKQQAKELYDSGSGVYTIADRLGIHKCLVNYYLFPEGCNKRAWARILHWEAGMEPSEIAKVLDIGPSTCKTFIGERQ
jgi:predicted transcriptional regulator